jgi:hypothetical protein
MTYRARLNQAINQHNVVGNRYNPQASSEVDTEVFACLAKRSKPSMTTPIKPQAAMTCMTGILYSKSATAVLC